MKILALEREMPGVTDEGFRPHLKEEAVRAWALYQQGIFREMYFDADHHTVVLVLECDGLDEAHHVLDTLPLVQAGLIRFETIPLVPYTGFARLFAEAM